MLKSKLGLLMMVFVIITNILLAGCGWLDDEDGIGGVCHDCTISWDCNSDSCTCVFNTETDARWCWACVPPEYDPLTGARQDETYTCSSVVKL